MMEKRSILLVEDDEVVRELTREVIEREYSVIEAATCSEANKQLSKHVDLALIDCMLPDGDGFDVLKAIKKMKPEIPVIMMTGYSTENLIIKAFRAGVTDFVRKPVSLAYLKSKLSEILMGKENKECAESGCILGSDLPIDITSFLQYFNHPFNSPLIVPFFLQVSRDY